MSKSWSVYTKSHLNAHSRNRLFDKRGGLYSSRPQSYLTTTLICPNESHLVFVKYGPIFRALRKTLNSLLSISVVDKLVPIQTAEASHTLHDLLSLSQSTDTSVSKTVNEDEGNYYNNVRRFGSAVVLASVFGQRAKSFFTPRVQDLFRVQDQFSRIGEVGATPPVDAFPFLRYMPGWIIGGPWKEKARAVKKAHHALYFDLVKDTRERRGSGVGKGGFMAKLLDALDEGESVLTAERIAYLGGTLVGFLSACVLAILYQHILLSLFSRYFTDYAMPQMEGGSDTTASTLLSFILAIVKHPNVLSRCWEEVDSACGNRRSPTSSDLLSLPYIRACLTEVRLGICTIQAVYPFLQYGLSEELQKFER